LKKEKFSFDTETEVALKNMLEKAKKENIEQNIAAEYQQLLTALQKSEEQLLDKNKKEISKLIQDELIKRYQFKEGLYQYYTKSNVEISRAIALFTDKSEYNKILKM
jgi:carboxyl-terminal processing protease